MIRLLSELCKNDNRTVYAKNLTNIARECHVDKNELSSNTVKRNMKYCDIVVDDIWRLDLLVNLLQ